jgi:hypothetical protein
MTEPDPRPAGASAEQDATSRPGISKVRVVLACLAASAVAGAALFASAPAPLLIDIPKYDIETDEFGGTVQQSLTPLYDVDDWPQAPPGTLAAAEEIEDTPEGFRSWRILYHSTDLQGNDLPVTGVYVVPDREPPPGGFPLLTFAHGTLGTARVCGVSQEPYTPGTPANTGWDPHLKPIAEHGFAVVASDYSGMGAPGPRSYLVQPLEARGVLDAARAVAQPDPRIGSVPVDRDKVGIYGKSQGGGTVFAAVELAPTYAPELDVKGAVSLAPGFLVPIPGALDLVGANPTSTAQNYFTMLFIASYADNFPEVFDIEDVLTPEGIRRLPLLDELCSTALNEAMGDVALSELVRFPIDRGVVAAMAKGMSGQTASPIPQLVLQGLEDVTILPQLTHAQVMARCALGDTVEYVQYPEDDHPSLNYQARLAEPGALDWLDERFDGEPATSNCPNQLIGIGSGSAR